MNTLESRLIFYERGDYWIAKTNAQYTVYRNGVTCATADSSYPSTPDGESLSIARTDYLSPPIRSSS